MKKFIIVVSLLFCILYFGYMKNSENIVNSFRFRIIANSNSASDQDLKTRIRDDIYNQVLVKTLESSSLSESKRIIDDNIDSINDIVSKYNTNYSISYGYNYFPNKTYMGKEYEEGEYDSLVISLGEAKGENWWCILFPPLCLVDAQEDDTEEVHYDSYISKFLKSFF